PLDPEQGRHRGVIYTIAPSFTRPGLLWVGTDDGLIHVTHDGGRRWTDVTPTALTPWSKVSLMEASHFDTLVAYAAVNRFRLDDLRPHIYRTKDGGRTWTEVVEGMPSNEAVNAMLDYYLARPAAGPVVVEIRDRSGALVRRFASDDRPEPPDTAVNIPLSWIRPSPALATERGMHRFVWDLHGAPPPALQHEYPISAIPGDTPRDPRGPWVLPGSYTVRLTVDGMTLTQPLAVRMDPRLRPGPGALEQQFAL